MSKLKTLTVAFLSIVLGAGVVVGVAQDLTNQPKEAVAASTTTLYLDLSNFSNWGNDSALFKVHTWNNSKGDIYHPATKVSDKYWKADVDLATYSNGGGYRFTRFNSNGSSEWNRGLWCSYSSTPSYYYQPTDWTEKGTWSKPLDTQWSIIGGNSTDSWATANFETSLSDVVFNGSGLQYYKESVYLEKGLSLKVKDSTGATWLGFNSFETGTGSAISNNYLTGSGDSNLEVAKTGYYDFYFKILTKKVWAQENSNESATAWANSFINDLSCDASGKVAPSVEQWTTLKTSFESLTIGAQTFLKEGTANENSADPIEKALAKYDFILGKYGSSNYVDFLERHEASELKLGLTFMSENNGLGLTILLISCTVIGVFVLGIAIKRKRNNKSQ